MVRLPTVGGDSGNWGTILNEFLSEEHDSDGTHGTITPTDIKAQGPWVDVRNYASLSAAITAIGASNKTLLIPNEQTVSADVTVPANIHLLIIKGGSLSIDAGVTVTINGPFEAGPHQIFLGNGTVTFSTASRGVRHPEWDQGAGIITSAAYKIYVSTSSGDDTNTGSSSEPLKTLKEAFDRIPRVIHKHGNTVGGGEYDQGDPEIEIILTANETYPISDYNLRTNWTKIKITSSDTGLTNPTIEVSGAVLGRRGLVFERSTVEIDHVDFDTGATRPKSVLMISFHSHVELNESTVNGDPTSVLIEVYYHSFFNGKNNVDLAPTGTPNTVDGLVVYTESYGCFSYKDTCSIQDCDTGIEYSSHSTGDTYVDISNCTIGIKMAEGSEAKIAGPISDCTTGIYIDRSFPTFHVNTSFENCTTAVNIVRGAFTKALSPSEFTSCDLNFSSNSWIAVSWEVGDYNIGSSEYFTTLTSFATFARRKYISNPNFRSTSEGTRDTVTVKLQENISDEQITFRDILGGKGNLEIDLNGKTLTLTYSGGYLMFADCPGTEITVKDGTIKMDNTNQYAIYASKSVNLYVENVTIDCNNKAAKAAIYAINGAVVKYYNVTFSNTANLTEAILCANGGAIIASEDDNPTAAGTELVYKTLYGGIIAGKEGINPLSGTVVWDLGNLADGAGETKQLTVTGAALGDFVLVSAPYDLQDIVATAYVQAANTVEIRLQNESGSAINLGSGTWKVKVIK